MQQASDSLIGIMQSYYCFLLYYRGLAIPQYYFHDLENTSQQENNP